MIRQDRVELNKRFQKVFEILVSRGDIILNDRNGKGIGDFAERILGNRSYGHIVRAYLSPNKKRYINYHEAEILCNEYGVNEEYLIRGIGQPFGSDLPSEFESTPSDGNILYTSVSAFAGSGVSVAPSSSVESNTFFTVPGYEGPGYVAFPIEGDSMEPLIQDGDIVICKEISGVNEIKDNEVYAVRTNGDIWIKFIQKIVEKNRVRGLKLISANYLEYDPFEEPVNSMMKLYKVISRINRI